MTPVEPTLDPTLDLEIARTISASRAAVWRAWTDPELLMKWWTPKPVETIACRIDLRPGGLFHTTMRLPDGSEMPSDGCFLQVVPMQRIVFTDALGPGWRPQETSFMTAIITLADVDGGTLYAARVLHSSAAKKDQHESMGFADGWGTAIAQLGELAGTLDSEEGDAR